jgi:hypothetical protein
LFSLFVRRSEESKDQSPVADTRSRYEVLCELSKVESEIANVAKSLDQAVSKNITRPKEEKRRKKNRDKKSPQPTKRKSSKKTRKNSPKVDLKEDDLDEERLSPIAKRRVFLDSSRNVETHRVDTTHSVEKRRIFVDSQSSIELPPSPHHIYNVT